jgi:hypothetical protein
MPKPTTRLPSFTCTKCKRRWRGEPSIYATALKSGGFRDVKLCVKCYWQTVGLWSGEGESLLKALREEIEIFRDQHGIDEHAKARREQTEKVENYVKNRIMFDSMNMTEWPSEREGRKLLDELGINYSIHSRLCIDGITYRPDACIELNNRRLIIEFDGSIHDTEAKKAKDEIRDYNLTANDSTVLRFSLSDLMNRRTYVRSAILDALCNENHDPWKLNIISNGSDIFKNRIYCMMQ